MLTEIERNNIPLFHDQNVNIRKQIHLYMKCRTKQQEVHVPRGVIMNRDENFQQIKEFVFSKH